MFLAEESVYLPQRVAGIIEADEKSLLAFRAAHGGLEGVNVRAARLVLLLHLHGVEAFFQREFARAGFADVVQREDGEDAAINAFVADLRLFLRPPRAMTAQFSNSNGGMAHIFLLGRMFPRNPVNNLFELFW